MNLHYDPTPEALTALIATAQKSVLSHNIAIDYDGEVLIDPEVHYPNVDVNRYKFCAHVRDASLHNESMVQALHRSLLKIFEAQMLYMGNPIDLSAAA